MSTDLNVDNLHHLRKHLFARMSKLNGTPQEIEEVRSFLAVLSHNDMILISRPNRLYRICEPFARVIEEYRSCFQDKDVLLPALQYGRVSLLRTVQFENIFFVKRRGRRRIRSLSVMLIHTLEAMIGRDKTSRLADWRPFREAIGKIGECLLRTNHEIQATIISQLCRLGMLSNIQDIFSAFPQIEEKLRGDGRLTLEATYAPTPGVLEYLNSKGFHKCDRCTIRRTTSKGVANENPMMARFIIGNYVNDPHSSEDELRTVRDAIQLDMDWSRDLFIEYFIDNERFDDVAKKENRRIYRERIWKACVRNV